MKGLNVLLAAFVVFSLTVGCQTFGGGAGSLEIPDDRLARDVKSKLVADPRPLTLVDVEASGGTVYLNGEVGSDAEKARAESLAWQVAGVKDVVNNLQIAAGSPSEDQVLPPLSEPPTMEPPSMEMP